MIPAQQGLETGDRLVGEADDRLVMDDHLLAFERPAQVGLHRQDIGGVLAQGRAIGLNAVAAEPFGLLHGDLAVLDHLLDAAQLWVHHGDADRSGEEDFAIGEGDGGAQGAAQGIGEGGDAFGFLLGDQDEAEAVAVEPGQGVLGLQQPSEPARDRQQNGIADRQADAVIDFLEAVDVDDEDRRPGRPFRLGAGDRGVEPVEEQFAVGQAGQIVVHGIVEQALLGGLDLGDVGQGADTADDLAVAAQHRPGAKLEPAVMAVIGAEPEFLGDAAAALVDHGIEGGAETIAIAGMEHAEPVAGAAFERTALEAERVLGLGAGENAVAGDVPVPDHVARADQGKRLALGVADQTFGDGAAGESVLHDGEAEQEHDEDEAAGQRRGDQIVGEQAGHRQPGAEHPGQQDDPGRDQHDGAVVALERQPEDEQEADDADEAEGDAGDAGRHRRVEHGQHHQREQADQPGDGDMAEADMPAIEVEIGEQEDQEGRRQRRLGASAVALVVAGREREDFVPEAELDAEIGQHGPGQERDRGEHAGALDHEQNSQEQCQQAGDADDDALIEGRRIDVVLIGVGLPEIELGQFNRAQFGNEGDDGARIEGDQEDVGLLARLAFGGEALARRDGGDA